MCGGGPKGLSAEEIAAQTKANKELVDTEISKMERAREIEKEKKRRRCWKVKSPRRTPTRRSANASKPYSAASSMKTKTRSLCLMGLQHLSSKTSRSPRRNRRRSCSRLGSKPQWHLPTHSPLTRASWSPSSSKRSRPFAHRLIVRRRSPGRRR